MRAASSDGPLLVSIRITVTPGHPQFYHPSSRKDSNFLLPLRHPSPSSIHLAAVHRFFHSISLSSFFPLFLLLPLFLFSLSFFFLFSFSSNVSPGETQSVSHRGLLGFPRWRKEGRRKLAGCLPRLPCLRQGNRLAKKERERKERRKRLVDQRETLILFLRETFDGGRSRSPLPVEIRSSADR